MWLGPPGLLALIDKSWPFWVREGHRYVTDSLLFVEAGTQGLMHVRQSLHLQTVSLALSWTVACMGSAEKVHLPRLILVGPVMMNGVGRGLE